MARAILARMQYTIVPAEDLFLLPGGLDEQRPDLRFVDETLLESIPKDEPPSAPPVPIVLLTAGRRSPSRDPRIVAAVRKPAGMHELYRVIQQLLEDHPRATPRVATELNAHCRAGERFWPVAILSLSENGCLMHCEEPVELGAQVVLVFDLPGGTHVQTEAEVAYQLVSDLGLVFHATPAATRRAIGEYVARRLAPA